MGAGRFCFNSFRLYLFGSITSRINLYLYMPTKTKELTVEKKYWIKHNDWLCEPN